MPMEICQWMWIHWPWFSRNFNQKVNDPLITHVLMILGVITQQIKLHQSIWIQWPFPKTLTKGQWLLDDLWPQICWGHMHRRTGRCGVLAIATWAAWFWAAQGRLLTKKKEERKGRKREKEERKKKRKRKKRKGKKEKRRKGRRLETDMGRLFRV